MAAAGVTADIVDPPVTDTGWIDDEARAFVKHNRQRHALFVWSAESMEVQRALLVVDVHPTAGLSSLWPRHPAFACVVELHGDVIAHRCLSGWGCPEVLL